VLFRSIFFFFFFNLVLAKIYSPIWAEFPNNPTLQNILIILLEFNNEHTIRPISVIELIIKCIYLILFGIKDNLSVELIVIDVNVIRR